jgi:hypothetical protein
VDGGIEAVNLKVAEQYVAAFAQLAKQNNTVILPANVADVSSWLLPRSASSSKAIVNI